MSFFDLLPAPAAAPKLSSPSKDLGFKQSNNDDFSDLLSKEIERPQDDSVRDNRAEYDRAASRDYEHRQTEKVDSSGDDTIDNDEQADRQAHDEQAYEQKAPRAENSYRLDLEFESNDEFTLEEALPLDGLLDDDSLDDDSLNDDSLNAPGLTAPTSGETAKATVPGIGPEQFAQRGNEAIITQQSNADGSVRLGAKREADLANGPIDADVLVDSQVVDAATLPSEGDTEIMLSGGDATGLTVEGGEASNSDEGSLNLDEQSGEGSLDSEDSEGELRNDDGAFDGAFESSEAESGTNDSATDAAAEDFAQQITPEKNEVSSERARDSISEIGASHTSPISIERDELEGTENTEENMEFFAEPEVDLDELDQQIQNQFARLRPIPEGGAQIRMSIPGIGNVDLKITNGDNGDYTVDLTVADQRSAEMLSRDQSALRDQLRLDGRKVEINIQTETGSDTTNSNEQQQGKQNRQQDDGGVNDNSPNNRWSARRQSNSDQDPADTTENGPQRGRVTGQGLVDALA